MSEAKTNPAVVELRYIRVGVGALVGTGNVLIWSGIIWFTPAAEFGTDVGRMIAGLFILVGVIQKLVSLSKWVELYRNR